MWDLARLGDVAEVIGGSTPKTGVADYWGGTIPWATPADLSKLDGAVISDTPRKLTELGLANSGARMLPAGAVLLSSRAPIGHVAVAGVPMATNQGFKSLVADESRLVPFYLYWWLKANTSYLQSLGVGATFKEISKAITTEVRIPLPALAEQRRVVSILDSIQTLRTLRQSTITQLESERAALFAAAFGDSAAFHGDRRPLGSLASKYSDGPFGSDLKSSHYTEGGVRVVRLQNIGVGVFLDDDRAFVSESHFRDISRHECLPGDVLIGTLGDPNLRACIQPESIPTAVNKADCVQFRPDTNLVTAEYIEGFLNHPSTVAGASQLVLGQTRGRISMGRLRGLEVPVPPLAAQEAFSRLIRSWKSLRDAQVSHLGKLDELFASLQHRAFRGEL